MNRRMSFCFSEPVGNCELRSAMSISWRQQSSTSGNRCCPSDWSYDGIAGLGYRREGKRDRTLTEEQGIFVDSGANRVCHAKNVSQEARVMQSKFFISSHLTAR